MNAFDKDNESPLHHAIDSDENRLKVPTMLELVCGGARIDEKSLKEDKSGVLRKVEDRLNLLRNQKPITDLFSVEERRFLEHIALCFASKYCGNGKKLFYDLLYQISFHGIFMTSDHAKGSGSIWKTEYPEF